MPAASSKLAVDVVVTFAYKSIKEGVCNELHAALGAHDRDAGLSGQHDAPGAVFFPIFFSVRRVPNQPLVQCWAGRCSMVRCAARGVHCTPKSDSAVHVGRPVGTDTSAGGGGGWPPGAVHAHHVASLHTLTEALSGGAV